MLLGATCPPAHSEGSARVEHVRDPSPDLDGLQPAAEGLVEGALDQPLEPALEPLESHATRSVPVTPFAPTFTGANTGKDGTTSLVRSPLRASGGIGRRAGFRCLCSQERGGSSPPSPTGLSLRQRCTWAVGMPRVRSAVHSVEFGHADPRRVSLRPATASDRPYVICATRSRRFGEHSGRTICARVGGTAFLMSTRSASGRSRQISTYFFR